MKKQEGSLLFWLVVALLVLSGCEGDDTISGVDSLLQVRKAGGDDQVGAPGVVLPAFLRVSVLDGDQMPVAGADVSWATLDGVIQTTSTTDATGTARASWTLGAGAVVRVARATASVGGSVVPFVAYAVPADHVVIRVEDTGFVPATPTVPPGTTVTWVWLSHATSHNVEPVGGSVLPQRSGDPVNGPFLYSQNILFSGVFNYQCVAHAHQGTVFGSP